MIHNFDPYDAMQQLATNQKQLDENQKHIVTALNQMQKNVQDHQQWLELNQITLNQVLSSLQNQYTMIMGILNSQVQDQAVNNNKGNGADDQTSNSNQSR